jgi:hypothetical protein
MMEDNRVAKSFLSAIIGERIIELEFSAQEHTVQVDKPKSKKSKAKKRKDDEDTVLTVCRVDFSARIAIPSGYKTVTIELQKAKLSSDIMRFRRYLGVHYQNPENSYGKEPEKARQIYCIFLLDYGMDLPERPVLEVNFQVKDVTTGEELSAVNEFIESLHHRSWIVQIRQLKSHRRNDLEKLLSIFDQDNLTADHHILNVDEDSFPEEYRHIIRRLRKANESEKIKKEMELEDDIVEELRKRERKIEEQEKVIEEQDRALGEKDKALEEKEKVLEERDKVLEEKDRALEEKEKVLNEKDREIETLKRLLNKK